MKLILFFVIFFILFSDSAFSANEEFVSYYLTPKQQNYSIESVEWWAQEEKIIEQKQPVLQKKKKTIDSIQKKLDNLEKILKERELRQQLPKYQQRILKK